MTDVKVSIRRFVPTTFWICTCDGKKPIRSGPARPIPNRGNRIMQEHVSFRGIREKQIRVPPGRRWETVFERTIGTNPPRSIREIRSCNYIFLPNGIARRLGQKRAHVLQGYRKPSISDHWNTIHRWPSALQQKYSLVNNNTRNECKKSPSAEGRTHGAFVTSDNDAEDPRNAMPRGTVRSR